MTLLGFALFTPGAAWIGDALVRASGTNVVSNFDIASFLLSGPGFAFFVVTATLSLGLLLAELAGLTWIAARFRLGRRTSAVAAAAQVMRRLPSLLLLAGAMLLRLAGLAMPFLAVAVFVARTQLGQHDINYYLAEQPAEWRRSIAIGAVLGLAYALLAASYLLRWSFAVPLLMLDGRAAVDVLRESSRLAGRHLRRIALPLLLWWGGLSAALLLVAALGRRVADAAFNLAGADLRQVIALTALCLASTLLAAFATSGLQFAGHQFLVTAAHLRSPEAGARRRAPDPIAVGDAAPRAWLPGLALLVLVVVSCVAVASTAMRFDPKLDVQVTAHRGASAHAPENSLAAFRLAMSQGATHAELDVQRARDGTLVVLHDADFMRMAGVPSRVATLTAAEISAIDIGVRRGTAFAGEHAPSLSEVIALVRGRMKLNVELKYNVRDPHLASAVVELLRREKFLDQAVISSLDAAALRQVRSLEPRLRIGLIVTAAVGRVTRADVDFLSLNAARVTPSLLRQARAMGMQVHAWTVNEPDAMLHMIERGVDNIITDDPAMLSHVLRTLAALDGAERIALRLRVLYDRPPRTILDPTAVPLQ